MPKTKVYSDRRREMNKLFRTRCYTLEELRTRVSASIGTSISKKTIQDMIKYMREEGAPIKNIPGHGYIYDPIGFNIEEIKVAPASVEKIKLAAAILEQIPGLDLHEELNEVFEKLEMRIANQEETKQPYIQFDTRPEYKGAKYLSEILEAIKGQIVIGFDYQPFKHDKPKQIVVHPYLLKEYNNRWFLIGLPELLRKQKQYVFHQYGLERIKSKIRVEKTEYYLHNTFDAAILYKDVIGVSSPQGRKAEKVVLRFAPDRAKYVNTNPWHHSQIPVAGTENSFTFKLIPNMELESLILSFGGDVEVVEPKSLRKSISEKIKLSNSIYLREESK